MTNPAEYMIEGRLSASQVTQLLETGRATFPDWKEAWSSERQQLHLSLRHGSSGLSRLLSEVDVRELEITGHILPGRSWRQRLAQAINAGQSLIRHGASLTAQCFYNEVESHQAADCGDNIGLSVEQDRCYFFYRANASKAGTDATYRERVLHDMISIVQLPVSITSRNGHFYLARSGSGSLWISQSGLRDRDPSGFRCEVSNSDVIPLLDGIAVFLQKYASNLFSCSWQVCLRTEDLRSPILSDLLTKLLRTDEPLADQYDARLAFMVNTIESLDAIRASVASTDLAVVHLGAFTAPSGSPCQLEATIDPDGFQISVVTETEETDDISAISSSFGVALRSHSS